MILTKTIDSSPHLAEASVHTLVAKPLNKSKLRSALFASSLFILMNLGGLALYNHSLKYWDSPLARAARETGQFNPISCLKDLPMFNWSLQDGYERTLDAKVHKLASVKKPDVVLLGSSLMIFPLWFADHGDNLPDQAYYSFRSKALEKQCTHTNQICNMALPLLNASDAERLVDNHLVGEQRPDVLVYGVGPRDFYDAYIGKPDASVYFDRLSNFEDFTTNWKTYFANPYDEAVCIGKRAYFLYSKHDEILLLGKSILKEILHLNKATTIVPLTDMGPRRNLGEYEGHYKNISANALQGQFKFLEQLLAICSKRHIRVILLSMPLTAENRSLLPEHIYNGFNEELAKLASSNGQKFVNLNSGEFDTADYLDSAHLNANGAHKLVERVGQSINAELVPAKSKHE